MEQIDIKLSRHQENHKHHMRVVCARARACVYVSECVFMRDKWPPVHCLHISIQQQSESASIPIIQRFKMKLMPYEKLCTTALYWETQPQYPI